MHAEWDRNLFDEKQDGTVVSSLIQLSNWLRPSHALKNLLILPGAGLGWILAGGFLEGSQFAVSVGNVAVALLACCLVAAWNYALNDCCDREGDRWHPEKSGRVAVGERIGFAKLLAVGVALLSGAVAVVWLGGLGTAVAVVLGLFALSGALYNIPPARLKRFPFLDVMAEAVNFPIRLALGWYAVVPQGPLPPLSALLAMWAFGGVLLTGKRAAELARIGDAATARAYRPALLHYTRERALVVSSLYGMVMLFGAGVICAVYPPLHNLIFLLPAVLALMGLYFWTLADADLAARELEPEKLLRRRAVWLAGLALGLLALGLVGLPDDLTARLGFFGGGE